MIKNLTLMSLTFVLILSAASASEGSTRGSITAGQDRTDRIIYRTSSSYSLSHDGSKAMDGRNDTSWISERSTDDNHWIEINFGTKRLMTEIRVDTGKKDGYHTIRRYKLQFFYRGEWFDFKEVECEQRTFTGRRRYFSKAEIDLEGIDASRFRIFIPADATYAGYAAIENIEVWLGSAKVRFYDFDERLKGMVLPVKNGILPENSYSYPNAPRNYRGGTHVGLDIFHYHKDNDPYEVKHVDNNTPVLAADAGTVIRADLDYEPLSPAEWHTQSNYYRRTPQTFVRNSFGGIQIWIDHGNGVITTYNHLSEIHRSIKPGTSVRKGQQIGTTGNSGLLGDSEGTDEGIHLHFEIWIDGQYLGYGMKFPEIKNYIERIFFHER